MAFKSQGWIRPPTSCVSLCFYFAEFCSPTSNDALIAASFIFRLNAELAQLLLRVHVFGLVRHASLIWDIMFLPEAAKSINI